MTVASIFRIIISLIILFVLIGIHVYLYRRLVRDVTQHLKTRWLGGVIIALLALALPFVRFAFKKAMPPPLASTLLFLWWGVCIYTFMTLLSIKVSGWLLRLHKKQPSVDLPRRIFMARATAVGALAVGGGFTAFGSYRAFYPPVITEVPIKLPGLPKTLDGFTIVQLSDIHAGPIIQKRFVDVLVQLVNHTKADLVAITGDLVDGRPSQLNHCIEPLKNLASRHGTFFVSGNHEYYSGWEAWARVLPGLGFVVLRNRSVTIGDAGGSFDLIGVEDYGGGLSPGDYNLNTAIGDRNINQPSVLLAHQPHGLEQAAEKLIGLQLSGHTHGGQTFPGTLLGQIIWGDRNAGLSQHNGTLLYTSRGCGFVGPPVRIDAPPEIVKVILLAEA